MLQKHKSLDELTKRCEILESFGFTIDHEDSRVYHPNWESIMFDFSAIDLTPEDILHHTIYTVYEHAFTAGGDNLRRLLNQLLRG